MMIGATDMVAFVLGVAANISASWIIWRARYFFVIDSDTAHYEAGNRPLAHRKARFPWRFTGAIATGVSYVLVFHLLGRETEAFLTLAVLSIMLLIARLDWQEGVVPDIFVIALLGLGSARLGLLGLDILDALAGGVVSAVVMALLMAANAWRQGREGILGSEIAWGDVTLMFGLGFLVGGALLPGFWLCAGLAHVIAFVVTRKGRQALRKSEALPMAPALCAGAALTILGQETGWLGIWLNFTQA